MTTFIRITLIAISAILLCTCSADVPKDAIKLNEEANVYPDYNGVAIPYNIAPLNFDIDDIAEDYITRIYSNKDEIIVRGSFVDIPEDEWKNLLYNHKSDSLYIDIFEKREGKWMQLLGKSLYITSDSIDPYLVYRLIEPSYVAFEDITINQRNITNFETKIVYDNMAMSDGDNGQCVNCHSFQDYNLTGRMQMHFRVTNGGTLIMQNNDIKKVNLKTGSAISTGVYPSWHPTKNIIAYSLNETGQDFRTKDTQKVEVLDYASDIVLYDIDKNITTYVAHDSLEFETFPYWSPDGKWLYYCCAHFQFYTDDPDTEMANRYTEVKYNIIRRSFDERTSLFGKADTIFNAAKYDKSATFPRVSPDGKYMLFTMADYGNFHIWHKSADLYIKDLETGNVRPLREVNSSDVESYHAWSRNGRWIVVSSRRDDGNYTRPYIAWFDKDGKDHKPFILPQNKSHFYRDLYKSFNIPEFIVSPVVQDSRAMVNVLKGSSIIPELIDK